VAEYVVVHVVVIVAVDVVFRQIENEIVGDSAHASARDHGQYHNSVPYDTGLKFTKHTVSYNLYTAQQKMFTQLLNI